MLSEIEPKAEVASNSVIYRKTEAFQAVKEWITEAWQNIAPFWPLKNLIAANPLRGLEDLPFEQALSESAVFFQQSTVPVPLEVINQETIKWCQAFFDEGQATIAMPMRHLGLYHAWQKLAQFDSRLSSDKKHRQWIATLPHSPEQAIVQCLIKLNISPEFASLFLTLLLTTLPGWASYVKYCANWTQDSSAPLHPVSQADYLAIRIVTTYLLWPEATGLITWHQNTKANSNYVFSYMRTILNAEEHYRRSLLHSLTKQTPSSTLNNPKKPITQVVFCIDVRSEPFRRALELEGDYDTYGFAGFFGLPVQIDNPVSGESYPSCPVLLAPKHRVKEVLTCTSEQCQKDDEGKKRMLIVKRFYQILKYNFTTPFVLVEALGPWSGLWMLLRTIFPGFAKQLKKRVVEFLRPAVPTVPLLVEGKNTGISFLDQCAYAESALRMINLIDNFAPLVVLCGHGSTTQNNAYASALDCGACGGHEGSSNAKILAAILNDQCVRHYLAKGDICIPDETTFIAAKHNTTTDEVLLYGVDNYPSIATKVDNLKQDLEAARRTNSRWRCKRMGYETNKANQSQYTKHTNKRSMDWAQTRPEWGLARNAAFIIAPRNLTKHIDLEGRSFLHSYNWEEDKEGTLLTTILTAPMVVAQWINSQYLFSSLDNVAYGSGSKITHNVTGKIGIMQGNGSDLMHGLPLQSIYSSDVHAYHQPLRLMTIVYAPRCLVSNIISNQAVLQKLFGNGWVALACIEPEDGLTYTLERDLTWQKMDLQYN